MGNTQGAKQELSFDEQLLELKNKPPVEDLDEANAILKDLGVQVLKAKKTIQDLDKKQNEQAKALEAQAAALGAARARAGRAAARAVALAWVALLGAPLALLLGLALPRGGGGGLGGGGLGGGGLGGGGLGGGGLDGGGGAALLGGGGGGRPPLCLAGDPGGGGGAAAAAAAVLLGAAAGAGAEEDSSYSMILWSLLYSIHSGGQERWNALLTIALPTPSFTLSLALYMAIVFYVAIVLVLKKVARIQKILKILSLFGFVSLTLGALLWSRAAEQSLKIVGGFHSFNGIVTLSCCGATALQQFFLAKAKVQKETSPKTNVQDSAGQNEGYVGYATRKATTSGGSLMYNIAVSKAKSFALSYILQIKIENQFWAKFLVGSHWVRRLLVEALLVCVGFLGSVLMPFGPFGAILFAGLSFIFFEASAIFFCILEEAQTTTASVLHLNFSMMVGIVMLVISPFLENSRVAYSFILAGTASIATTAVAFLRQTISPKSGATTSHSFGTAWMMCLGVLWISMLAKCIVEVWIDQTGIGLLAKVILISVLVLGSVSSLILSYQSFIWTSGLVEKESDVTSVEDKTGTSRFARARASLLLTKGFFWILCLGFGLSCVVFQIIIFGNPCSSKVYQSPLREDAGWIEPLFSFRLWFLSCGVVLTWFSFIRLTILASILKEPNAFHVLKFTPDWDRLWIFGAGQVLVLGLGFVFADTPVILFVGCGLSGIVVFESYCFWFKYAEKSAKKLAIFRSSRLAVVILASLLGWWKNASDSSSQNLYTWTLQHLRTNFALLLLTLAPFRECIAKQQRHKPHSMDQENFDLFSSCIHGAGCVLVSAAHQAYFSIFIAITAISLDIYYHYYWFYVAPAIASLSCCTEKNSGSSGAIGNIAQDLLQKAETPSKTLLRSVVKEAGMLSQRYQKEGLVGALLPAGGGNHEEVIENKSAVALDVNTARSAERIEQQTKPLAGMGERAKTMKAWRAGSKLVPDGSRRFEMQSKNSSLLQLLEKTQKAHPEQVRTSKHQKSFSGPLDAETLLRRTVVNVSPPVTKSEDTSKHNQLLGSETVQDTKSTHKKLFASTSDLAACTTFVRTGLAVPVSGDIQSGSAARVSSCPDISVVAATANPCDDTMIQDELQHLRKSNSVLARARSPDLQPGGKLRTLLEQEIARAAAEAKATSINSSGSQSDDLRTQLKEEKDWACPPADMQQCQELLNQEGEPTLQVKKSVTEEESITKTGKEEMANHLSNADIPDAHGGDINDPPRNILQLLNRRRQKGGDVW